MTHRCLTGGLGLLALCAAFLGAGLFIGVAESITTTGWLIAKDGRRLVDSRQQPVVLRNNPQAANVALAQVLAFVKTNQVNTRAYRTGLFACTEFALALHDDAEAAGIRCGLVGVRFQRGVGHALNVFQTTDKGIVYVDCTGSPLPARDPGAFDTIAYLRIGRPYGRLPLELGAFDPIHYERYLYVMGLWNWVRAEGRQIQQAAAQLASQRAQWRNAQREPPGNARESHDPLGIMTSEPSAGRLEDWRQDQRALEERRAKLRSQLQRLGTRYDMNPAPVKTIDVWW